MGRIDDYANVGSDYNPNASDLFVLETTNGTRTISSDRVVNPYSKTKLDEKFTNPYSKTELDNKFSSVEKFSAVSTAELSSSNDPQTVYRGPIYTAPGTPLLTSTVFVSATADREAQLGIMPDGRVVVRTRTKLQNNTWSSWSNWAPIGTTDNIENGAITPEKLDFESVDTDALGNGSVTLPKLGSDVFESIDIDTIVDDGSETDTVTGVVQCFGDFCMMEVSIHFKRSVPYNSFTLPVTPLHHVCNDFTWWTSPATSGSSAYVVFISATDNKCYIKRQDNMNLSGNVSFSIVYRRRIDGDSNAD